MEIVLACGAAAGALTAVTTLLVRFYRAVKRIDSAIGTDDKGRTAATRLEETVSEIGVRLQRVEHQLYPNGGGSLADQVTGVDRQVVELRAQTSIVLKLLETVVADRDGRAH